MVAREGRAARLCLFFFFSSSSSSLLSHSQPSVWTLLLSRGGLWR